MLGNFGCGTGQNSHLNFKILVTEISGFDIATVYKLNHMLFYRNFGFRVVWLMRALPTMRMNVPKLIRRQRCSRARDGAESIWSDLGV